MGDLYGNNEKKLRKIWKHEKAAVSLQKKQQNIILCEIGI